MLAVGAIWAAAEALLFVVVPDVWVGLVAIRAPRRAAATLASIVLGAAAGAALLWLAVAAGFQLGPIIAALPGLSARDVAQVEAELGTQGSLAFLNGPLQGLPVKIYIHEASRLGTSLPELLLFVALNRIERIAPFTIVLAVAGTLFSGFVDRHRVPVTAGYLVSWAAFYAWYFVARAA